MLAAVDRPCVVGGKRVTVGGSIGIAGSESGANLADVLRNADTAMYRAKRGGGDMIVVFERRMCADRVLRADIASDLRRAVAACSIGVLFQPIVWLHDRRLFAAEALARWEHPTLGSVPPSDFIPIAEEAGIIKALGLHVLAESCAAATSWPVGANGGPAPAVSVNVSAAQLLDRSFVPDTRHILADCVLDPGRLILEITESTYGVDITGVVDRLRLLRDVGVRIAIDEFGTGDSSLAYVGTLPVDIVKIDRSLLHGMTLGPQGREFVRTIARLVDALSMTSLAEGVEAADQARELLDAGCVLGQGYPVRASHVAGRFTKVSVRRSITPRHGRLSGASDRARCHRYPHLHVGPVHIGD